MKFQMRAASIALCLLATIVLATGLKTPPTSTQSLQGQEVVSTVDRPYNPALPTVEEFILTPPDPSLNINKTNLSVRFAQHAAKGLAPEIPMVLSNQHVVLQRSAQDPAIFSASIDFDWDAFAKEQQQRKDAANSGRKVPIFEGRHFVGTEKMQFVEPDSIRDAVQSHQPIQFDRHILNGGAVTVLPNKELMIVDTAVVNDVRHTWDPCTKVGNPRNAWTFATLMTAIRNDDSHGGIPVNAEKMLDDLLNTWKTNQIINGFTIRSRPGITGLLSNWPTDSSGHHSLANAPVRLNAIVNRIDLGQAPNSPTPAGELRFVFGVTASTQSGGSCASIAPFFNIILEYNVPKSISAATWASEWNALALVDSPRDFKNKLQRMTNQVVTANACPTCPNGSALHQLRTNEVLLGTNQNWEDREFHLGQTQNPNELVETTIAQTPDGSYTGFAGTGNFGDPQCSQNPSGCSRDPFAVTSFIESNRSAIENGTYIVPLSFRGLPFRGGSAFDIVSQKAYWNGDPSVRQSLQKARMLFSENTCNGCHGRETLVDFQQVRNRIPGNSSVLTNFLLGVDSHGKQCLLNTPNLSCVEVVTDPVFGNRHSFGDIARRVVILQGLVTNGPRSGGILMPFVRPHVSFVH